MNRFDTNITNMINQPRECCIYCGKNYKKKSNLNKHIILCEILHNSHKKRTDDEEIIPSQTMIYKILLEFGERFTRLEKKVDELTKHSVQKQKKINVINWLNTNIIPEMPFEKIMDSINIITEDAKYLFNHNFTDTLNYIFSKSIYNIENIKYPIYAFVQKPHKLYIYESMEQGWVEINKTTLVMFLDKIHLKLYRALLMYKKENEKEIDENEKNMMVYHKVTIHMMDINFNKNNQLVGKIKNMIYTKINQDVQFVNENNDDV